ncbi:MAG: helix-turn-helix domain-containing protein [Renibacterium salmoninarum]|jgi:hypothetical protein|nr:helix-turn-helix domain-containing protein [Renibacterium salmoninarum]
MRRQVPAEWRALLEAAGLRSIRELSLRAQVSAPAVARLVHGDGKTSDSTILAVAAALAVSPAELYRLAGVKTAATAGPYLPPAESVRLSIKQRKIVDEVIRAMLERK